MGKPEAIKRETLLYRMITGNGGGGLNVVDIETKLQSLMIKQGLKLIKGNKVKWKYLAVYWIGLHLGKCVPSFASLIIPHSERTPS